MSNKREGPELQMQDVLLACGELNERERVAVQWTLDRHNEIVGSMCSKEGPSDEEINKQADEVSKVFYAGSQSFRDPLHRGWVEYAMSLGFVKGARWHRDHFPRSPKVGALLEAGDRLAAYVKGRFPDWGIEAMATLEEWYAAKADASLQGEGPISRVREYGLGDPLPSVGPASFDGRCAPSAEPTAETAHLSPPIAEHPQGQPAENPDAR